MTRQLRKQLTKKIKKIKNIGTFTETDFRACKPCAITMLRVLVW